MTDRLAFPRDPATSSALAKAATGVSGFDEITLGGLPAGRPTLVCGGPGCGKTLFAMTFLVNGATQFDEPGVFMSFEEASEDLVKNVVSLGYDVQTLIDEKRLALDYVRVEKGEIEEAGDYDLDGLFVRLGYAIDQIGAKRVVLDTLEVLFAGLGNTDILRAELRRLFAWLKEKGVTAVITAERGEGSLTRYGLEEYISDCVLFLDNRVEHQITTRRIRVVKYRGSAHGTNEYPFLIDDQGISVLPITSAGLSHSTNNDAVSTGVTSLDGMLGIGGFYRGSSILISGTAGTGKTSLASHFVEAACRRGEKCLYFAFEESPAQIVRNMRSIGIDLEPWIASGLLRFEAARPSLFGLEMHLARMHREIENFKPDVVVLDPISSLRGEQGEVHSALLRVIDLLKSRGTTALLTNLNSAGQMVEGTDLGMSSLMDTWLSLVHVESNGERNRGLYILKSRGMSHSNQVREFEITSSGVQLVSTYLGSGGVLTGSARIAREAADAADALRRTQESTRKRRDMERRRAAVNRQIAELQASLDAEEDEVAEWLAQDEARENSYLNERDAMATRRGAAE
ncbi:circadian clock protein KaiC [Aliirhizobium smilacinae]|uniref:non-specific serine/threonine protein kinase n=1 Tax=Aliirhizobium smilacinae TaxID=1395944 RepID=A0A5C4XNZ8_9HYPH|nr:circadian clock protein KaiC [Rhizobium smilacinae]TNM65256.1 circadian clock protein KaiC [Rhizobium smilacinae]